jgi:peptidoglycan/LPS O-acetylase OafA/YrhL
MYATTITARPTRSLTAATVVAGLGAAAVVTAAAAAVHAAGVSFEVQGEAIPALGFAQMTFLGAAIGGVLLAVLNRRSAQSRQRFLQATIALTAMSCIPSIAWPDHAGSKVSLVVLHVLAAIIVVPLLARHAAN